MRRHVRRANSILAFAVLALGLLHAEQVRQLKPNGFVNDFANVIDSESNRQIQYLCTQVDQRVQAQIAVVTVESLEGSTVDTFARQLFRQWGIGPKSNNRGVLILLAIRDHKYRIEVGKGLESVITDRKAAGFGREAVPFLKEFKYGRALQTITRRVTDAIATDAQISIGDAPAPTPAPAASYDYSSTSSSDMGGAIKGLLIALVLIVLVVWFLVGLARGGGYSGPSYGYGYGGPVYNNVGGYYNHSNTVVFNGFGGSNSSSGSSSWGGGGGFGGGGDSSSFGGGSSSGGGASGGWSSSDSSSSESSSSSSDSSSSSSDFGGGSSDGGGASGSW